MKRLCSWLLVLAMILTWLPSTTRAGQADAAGRVRPAETQTELMSLGQKDSTAQVIEPETPLSDDQLVKVIILLDDSCFHGETISHTARQQMSAQQAGVQAEISRRILHGAPLTVGYSYTTLVNGFSATVTYGQLQEIRKMPEVTSAFLAPSFDEHQQQYGRGRNVQ
mgnify:FL=1